jgi:excisionase family DNA binding protein
VSDPLTMLAELAAEVTELRARVQELERGGGTSSKRWLTVREAGAYLGCGDRAVYQRIRRGRISAGAVKHSGRSVLVDRRELDRDLERGA